MQATCGTLHFIENERSDKTLFGVFGQGVPALCLEVELLAIAGDEAGTEVGARDMADDADARQGGHALVVRQGNGEGVRSRRRR